MYKITGMPAGRFLAVCLILLPIFITSCKKEDTEAPLFTPAGTVKDIDGNTYNAIKIGEQLWLVENLRATRYRNGDSIPNVREYEKWDTLSTGAQCIYSNANSYLFTYGRLYNWYAVNDSRNIAPEGWRIPEPADWEKLVQNLQGWEGSGKLMKSKNNWSENGNGTNASGFTAYPGGLRLINANEFFDYIEDFGYWWTKGGESGNYGCAVRLAYNSNELFSSCNYYKTLGFSVRCVKDAE